MREYGFISYILKYCFLVNSQVQNFSGFVDYRQSLQSLSGEQKLHFCIAVFHKNCNILRTLCQSKLNICNISNFVMLNQNLMVDRQWQPSSGVLGKSCSKNMQQICRRTSLLKPPFGMGVLLLICCIFSEHPFIRKPMEGYF